MFAKLQKQSIGQGSPERFFNRELSSIEFNKRVLLEAEDKDHPLLERLKFISIFSSNIDEFFMIRVAGLKRQAAAGLVELSFDGMTPKKQLAEIRKRLVPLYRKQEEILNEQILPALEEENIVIHDYDKLPNSDKKKLYEYFQECVFPVLTPLSLDPAHPFPRLINRSLNIVFLLRDENVEPKQKKVAFLQIPTGLPRFLRLKRKSGDHFALIEEIVQAHADALFPGLKLEKSYVFRVTRDADFEIAEDEAEDLLTEIAEHIKIRRWGSAVVRLEVSEDMSEDMVEFLKTSLGIDSSEVYSHNRPLKMPDFMRLRDLDRRDLKDKPFQTRILPELRMEDVGFFDVLREKELLVHHPFDSFTHSVLKMLNEAVDDPDVLAIKITLYRVGMNSPIVAALKRAAENGKEVTAFVELKARFDEENNILWAKELERVGVHVVYGVIGLKTHCKILAIVRKESDKLRTYLHLATGNYNHTTARLYTDIGFFTSDPDFGMEAAQVFNYLTGYSYQKKWKQFFVAPINLRRSIIELINRETEFHSEESPGLIIAKMNSLAHREVINALYRASKYGVRIKLLVRGICSLRPGVPGLSENIEVRSVLGRFLEHSRIFYFKNNGAEEAYISSADWMTRNLQKRVELMFKIKNEGVKKKLEDILDVYWKDNTKSWILQPDGSYIQRKPGAGEKRFCAQEHLLTELKKSVKKTKRLFELKLGY